MASSDDNNQKEMSFNHHKLRYQPTFRPHNKPHIAIQQLIGGCQHIFSLFQNCNICMLDDTRVHTKSNRHNFNHLIRRHTTREWKLLNFHILECS